MNSTKTYLVENSLSLFVQCANASKATQTDTLVNNMIVEALAIAKQGKAIGKLASELLDMGKLDATEYQTINGKIDIARLFWTNGNLANVLMHINDMATIETSTPDGLAIKALLYVNYQKAYANTIRQGKYLLPQDTEDAFMQGITELYLDIDGYDAIMKQKGAQFGSVASGFNYGLTKAMSIAIGHYAKQYANDLQYTVDIDAPVDSEGHTVHDVIPAQGHDGYMEEPKTVYQTLRQVYHFTHKDAVKLGKAYRVLNTKDSSKLERATASTQIYRMRKTYGLKDVDAKASRANSRSANGVKRSRAKAKDGE